MTCLFPPRPFALGALLLSLASCTIQIAGNDRTAIVKGTVTDGASPVANVAVASGDVLTTTDTTGAFTLNLKGVPDRIVITATAKGFIPSRTLVEYRSGVFHYVSHVALVRPQNATLGGETVVTVGGKTFKVKVPAGAVPDGGRVELAVLTAEQGPGAMETTEGNTQRLQTAGMFYLRGVDAAGNPTPLKQGAGQGVTLSIATDVPAVAASEPMKIYTSNADALWEPNTATTATGADFQAQQEGYWNADRAYRTACVRGQMKAPNKSCSGEKVKAGGLDGLYTQDTTGADGQFCLEGPQTRAQPLTVGSKQLSITFPSTPGSCRANPLDCTELSPIDVTDADCPASCDKTKTDSPEGCQAKASTGSTDPFFGYQCSQAVACCPSSNQGCGRTYKSCADTSGGGGYITSDGKKYWCANSQTSGCIQGQAQLVVNYCMGN